MGKGVHESPDGLLEFAVDIARGAGAIALAAYRTSLGHERKADRSLVTAADRQAETYLRERIRQSFPDDEIVGEEFGTESGSSDRRWIVDPIDGTFSFVAGVPLFGVLVGVEVGGETIAGAAHFPALDETFAARRGGGCHVNGARTHTRPTQQLSEALVVGNDPQTALGLIRAAETYRGWGDAYAYALVASGRADVAFDRVMNVWDCAALAPIVEEAGGTFTDWRGHRTIRGGSAVATNGPLFNEVIALLR